MVRLSFEGTVEEVKKEMAAMLGVTEVRTTIELSPKDVKKAAEPKKAEVKSEPEKAEVKPAQAAAEAVSSGIEAVRGTIAKLMVKIGREKTVELLSEFGAKKGGELKEADYPKFLEKANEKLK